MNKRVIYPNDQGGVSVIVPADCGLTIEQIAAKDVPEGKEFQIVDVSEIPSDRTYRNAWEYLDGVKINIEKAIEIQKDKIRAERAPLLEDLDIQYMKALEAGDTQKQEEISAEKQKLRDVTALVVASNTEDLKKMSCENLIAEKT